MAELTETDPEAHSTCCAPEAQATCCEPSEKSACCGTSAAGGSCGCAAGKSTETADIRETVRAKYAAAARAASSAADAGQACCSTGVSLEDETGTQVFGSTLYDDEAADAPSAALNASLGCGVPTAVADLHEGETVLDLGSGAGADVLISAKRVGPTGTAIGIVIEGAQSEPTRSLARNASVT